MTKKDSKNKLKPGKYLSKKMILIFGIFLIMVVGVLSYLNYSGIISFSASTVVTEVSNKAYGTYTSVDGSGNIASNEIKVLINNP